MRTLNLVIPFLFAFITMIPMSFVHGDIMEVMGVSVYTDKDSYGKGETIKISGEIRSANGMTVSPNIPVTIRITSDTFQKQVAALVTYPSINGNFGVNIPTTNSSWKISDTYTVNASYGKIQGYSDNAIFSFEVGNNNLLSPLQQSKLGIATDKIECRSDLQLVFKSKSDFPACVKQQTAQTLVKRGWTKPESHIDIIGLNPNYVVGQPINATISYTGYMNGGLYPNVKILNANNGSEVWSNCLYSHTEHAGGGGIGTATYNVKCNDRYPVINITGNYMMVASVDKNVAKATFDVIESNMIQTSKESIRIIPEYPISTGINKNGTVTDSETIEILFDNFKQTNSPLVIQILNPHGEIYRVDSIPNTDIQSDGFYKYQIYIKGNQSAMSQYKVIVTHDNVTASILTYLSDVVP